MLIKTRALVIGLVLMAFLISFSGNARAEDTLTIDIKRPSYDKIIFDNSTIDLKFTDSMAMPGKVNIYDITLEWALGDTIQTWKNVSVSMSGKRFFGMWPPIGSVSLHIDPVSQELWNKAANENEVWLFIKNKSVSGSEGCTWYHLRSRRFYSYKTTVNLPIGAYGGTILDNPVNFAVPLEMLVPVDSVKYNRRKIEKFRQFGRVVGDGTKEVEIEFLPNKQKQIENILNSTDFSKVPVLKYIETFKQVRKNFDIIGKAAPDKLWYDMLMQIALDDTKPSKYRLNTSLITTQDMQNMTLLDQFERIAKDLGRDTALGCLNPYQTGNEFATRYVIDRQTEAIKAYLQLNVRAVTGAFNVLKKL